MTTVEYLAEALRRQVEQLPADLKARQLPDNRAADALVAEFVNSLQERDRDAHLADDLGPFYDSRGLERRWACTRQAVSKRRTQHRIIGIPTDDGRVMYPVWQFVPGSDLNPLPIPGLNKVLMALRLWHDGDLGHALWLSTPSPRLRGIPAYAYLLEHGPDHLVELAIADAAAQR